MKTQTALIVVLLLSSGSALAEPKSFPIGWTDLGSCNRIKYYKDSFGIKWPTNESVGQRLYGEIVTDIPNTSELIEKVKKCVMVGVAAAGLTSLLTGPEGAWPAFSAGFNSCAKAEGETITASALQIKVDTKCNW